MSGRAFEKLFGFAELFAPRFRDQQRSLPVITSDPKINDLAWREPRKGWGPLKMNI